MSESLIEKLNEGTREASAQQQIMEYFNRHDVEFRTLLLQCGHAMDFDSTYSIETTEYCEQCNAMVKVATDGIKSLDRETIEANK